MLPASLSPSLDIQLTNGGHLSMLNLSMKKVVITGGHLTPALGVIEEIEKDKEDWKIFYFGRKYALESAKKESFEFRTLNKNPKIKFIPITTGRAQRKFSVNSIKSFFKIPIGFFQAFYYLIKIKPKIIISFGSYLSVPVVISGWILGIPSITHEQTRTVGLGTKINRWFVKKIAVSFPEVVDKLPKDKTVLTGNPVESGVFNYSPPEKSNFYNLIKKSEKPILFVTGGKTGSKIINQTLLEIKEKLTEVFYIVHQIGLDNNCQELTEKNYHSFRFVDNKEFGWLLRQSDLVVSRSGANICTYLAALKKKGIVIPIPWSAGNEQYKNGLWLEKIGLGKIIVQSKLNKNNLYNTIKKFYPLDKNINLPEWWEAVNPKQAGKKLWQLAKSVQ